MAKTNMAPSSVYIETGSHYAAFGGLELTEVYLHLRPKLPVLKE